MLDETPKRQRFGSVCFFAGLPAFSLYKTEEIQMKNKKKKRKGFQAVCAAPIAAARLFSGVQMVFIMITVKE